MEAIREDALRWAIINAIEHGGKASVKAVVGKLIAERPELRPTVKELLKTVEEIVEGVNRMSLAEQIQRSREIGIVERPRFEKRAGLPELPEVEKYRTVVTRFAPNPNGPLHMGHMRAAVLSHEYARRYGGKFILRFEDTNPKNVRIEMYELIKLDLKWLGLDWDEEFSQSDRLELYYGYAERLLREGKAYVCTCDVERFRGLRDRGEPCPCRDLASEGQLRRWEGMLGGEFAEGGAVLRIKTDLGHPNPAVRDWPAMRVVKEPHPRAGTRYLVWPLYNFSVSIDDHEMGVTHVIRGKEHEVNAACQQILYEHLGWCRPQVVQYGRMSLAGASLSKTQIVQRVKAGELMGFDDVRLGTIAALRRRGLTPRAIKQLVLDMGPTPVDVSLSWETLYAYNRKFVDELANRYFFVPDPKRLVVRGAPRLREVRLRLHPSHPERGDRILPLAWEDDSLLFYVSGKDLGAIGEGEVFRLKDLMNLKLHSKGEPFRAEFQGLELGEGPKIQWVSAGAVEVEVIKPDNSREIGLAEPSVAGLKVGDIVQFERYGFVRIDATRPNLVVAYGHR